MQHDREESMNTVRSRFIHSVFATVLLALPFASIAGIQNNKTIDAGTTIQVRTNGRISADDADGRVFSGTVVQDVKDKKDNIEIPKGSDVELIVRGIATEELALDLDSITINGNRYGVSEQDDRPRKQIGVLGVVVGVITGPGTGSAGGNPPIWTQGNRINIPDESLLTIRLTQPFRPGAVDTGFMTDGAHFHSPRAQGAFATARQKPSHYSNGRGTVSIGTDKFISWNGPDNAVLYIQVDDQMPTFFASGPSGIQGAPWMTEGHVYTFILIDANGNEIARDQQDRRARR
jgi:hypothetical protein